MGLSTGASFNCVHNKLTLLSVVHFTYAYITTYVVNLHFNCLYTIYTRTKILLKQESIENTLNYRKHVLAGTDWLTVVFCKIIEQTNFGFVKTATCRYKVWKK